MTENEQFDDLIRKRFGNAVPGFNNKHWLEAEKLIIERERRDRNRKIILYSISLLILVSGIITWSYYKTGKEEALERGSVETKQVSEADWNNGGMENSGREKKAGVSTGIEKGHMESMGSIKKTDFPSNMPNELILNSGLRKSVPLKGLTASLHQIPPVEITVSEIIKDKDDKSEGMKNLDSYSSVITNPPSGLYEERVPINDVGSEKTDMLQNASDSSINVIPEVIPDAKNLQEQATNGKNVSIIAGGFLSRSFTGTEGSSGLGINLLLGASYDYKLNEEWGVEAALLYFEKGKVNTTKNFHSEYYNGEFGRREEDVRINTIKLQYLSVPVLLSFRFTNHKQILEAGAAFNFLMNATSKVYSSGQTTGSAGNSSAQKKDGYVNGFHQYDVSLHVGYSQSLMKNIDIGIRLHYGLKDVTKNDYFNIKTNDNAIGTQVCLKYKIY